MSQWIGLRDKLQENPILNGKNHGFRFRFSLKPNHWMSETHDLRQKNGGTTAVAKSGFLVNWVGHRSETGRPKIREMMGHEE